MLRDQAREGFPGDPASREAKEPLGRMVELADPALVVDRHDRVGGRVDDVPGLLLALAERLLGLATLDEVLLLRARVSSRIATDRRWFWQSIVVNTAITATGMPCATIKSFRP